MMIREVFLAVCILWILTPALPLPAPLALGRRDGATQKICASSLCNRRRCPCPVGVETPIAALLSTANQSSVFPSSTAPISSSSSTAVASTSSLTEDQTNASTEAEATTSQPIITTAGTPTTAKLVSLTQTLLNTSPSSTAAKLAPATSTPNKTPRTYAPASPCDPLTCRLPSCRCAGDDIPGGLAKNNTPQMILLTMDDGITLANIQLYTDLLDRVTNFNGCPVKATFFVSGDNTDYSLVKAMQERGHEIADHSVTHKFPIEWWSQNPSYAELEFEVVNQMKTIQQLVNITTRGWRNPFLESTENTFRVLADNDFLYDSTLGTSGELWWPFTLDHLPPSECYMSNCPKNSYPGLWEIPLVPWQCDQEGVLGTMIDECQDTGDEENVFNLIMKNFNIHYQNNKQPFPVFGHSSWFDNAPYRKAALMRFMSTVRMYEDVYFVTAQQAVQWMKSPIGLDKSPFSCR